MGTNSSGSITFNDSEVVATYCGEMTEKYLPVLGKSMGGMHDKAQIRMEDGRNGYIAFPIDSSGTGPHGSTLTAHIVAHVRCPYRPKSLVNVRERYMIERDSQDKYTIVYHAGGSAVLHGDVLKALKREGKPQPTQNAWDHVKRYRNPSSMPDEFSRIWIYIEYTRPERMRSGDMEGRVLPMNLSAGDNIFRWVVGFRVIMPSPIPTQSQEAVSAWPTT